MFYTFYFVKSMFLLKADWYFLSMLKIIHVVLN